MEGNESCTQREANRDSCENVTPELAAASKAPGSEHFSYDNGSTFQNNPNEHNKDFRKSLKYKEPDSYVSQRHHSIGTGLYMTDELEDLPPRFQTKVVNVVNKLVKNALESHNIPTDILNIADIPVLLNSNDSTVSSKAVPTPDFNSLNSKSRNKSLSNTNQKNESDQNCGSSKFFKHKNLIDDFFPNLKQENRTGSSEAASKFSIHNSSPCQLSASDTHISHPQRNLEKQNPYKYQSVKYKKNFQRHSTNTVKSVFNSVLQSQDVPQFETSCSSNNKAFAPVTAAQVSVKEENCANKNDKHVISQNIKREYTDTFPDKDSGKYNFSTRQKDIGNSNTQMLFKNKRFPYNSNSPKFKNIKFTKNNSDIKELSRSNLSKFNKSTTKNYSDSTFKSHNQKHVTNDYDSFDNCSENVSTSSKTSKDSKSNISRSTKNIELNEEYVHDVNFRHTERKDHDNFQPKNKVFNSLRTVTNSKFQNPNKQDPYIMKENRSFHSKYDSSEKLQSDDSQFFTSGFKEKHKKTDSFSNFNRKQFPTSFHNNKGFDSRSISDTSECSNDRTKHSFRQDKDIDKNKLRNNANFSLGRNINETDEENFSDKHASQKCPPTDNFSNFNKKLSTFHTNKGFGSRSIIDTSECSNDKNKHSYRQDKYINKLRNNANFNSGIYINESDEENFSDKHPARKCPPTDSFSNFNRKLSTFHTNKGFDSRSISDTSECSNDGTKHSYRQDKYINKNKLRNNANFSSGRNLNESDEENFSDKHPPLKCSPRKCVDVGFFIKVEVSNDDKPLDYWLRYLKNLFQFQFDVESCCNFSNILILTFENKAEAEDGYRLLLAQKKKSCSSLIISFSKIKYQIIKPCNCQGKVISDSIMYINKNAKTAFNVIDKKIAETQNFENDSKKTTKPEILYAIEEMLGSLKMSKSNFIKFKNRIIVKIKEATNLKSVQFLKLSFIRECNIFNRCLPIYSKKDDILESVRLYSVTVIVAETGSGKSSQIVEYLLHSDFATRGRIICTQPRKLAAISLAQFVSGQIGSAVGKIVGYDVGIDKKVSESTKIIYKTDYQFLKEFLTNTDLKGISCVIIDEAHERSLYTDLLLGMLKRCLKDNKYLSAIITSATIDPTIFKNYFNHSPVSVIEVPGRSFPVEVVWWHKNVDVSWNYVKECARKAYEIHTREKQGDILVFLTSPHELEEAVYEFRRLFSNKDEKAQLFCLHGKSELKEQIQIFHSVPQKLRKIIFSTNVAETSVTIPGIKFVIDSGMTKELLFDPKLNKSYLAVNFINKSSAEQRKGRAGRTQSGICYRMYSQHNYEECMLDSAVPEILRTNLQKALLRIFELGINPAKFDFIESPPKRTISSAVDALENMGAIEDNKLTDLGKNLSKLSIEPQLAKLVWLGMKAGIAYEAIIIAALVSESGKIFIRTDDRHIVDEKKKQFCHEGGDLCTYLEIFKRWKDMDIPDRYAWCVNNFISSKALLSASKTVNEIIISLQTEFSRSFKIQRIYNNKAFKKQYEKVLFESFSENLCVSSGHPKLGYLSPYLPESFFIHPSSTLSFLGKDVPEYLVYCTLMETSRNFLFDITPISEETIKASYLSGNFKLSIHSLKYLQIPPKVLGPFGESVLIRYILGKQGSKVKELENKIKNVINSQNVHLDVSVEKGLITFYSGQHFHEKIASEISTIIKEAHIEMLKEEDVVKLPCGGLHCALGAGGIVSDIIMPGEFRELILKDLPKSKNDLRQLLESYGPLYSLQITSGPKGQISAVYNKVCNAAKAYQDLVKKKLSVSTKLYLPIVSDKSSLFMLDISWCRLPCTGAGWVEFSSEEDLIRASGILTVSSFFIDDKYIYFTPSEHNTKEMNMKNLPKSATEEEVRVKLREHLPQDVFIEKIVVRRAQAKGTDSDMTYAKQKLTQLLGRYVPTDKFIIDIKHPCQNDNLWKANVYFENAGDGERLYKKLKGCAMIDSYKLSIEQVLEATINFKSNIYYAVEKQVKEYLLDKQYCVTYDIQKNGNFFNVKFTSSSIHNLNVLKRKLTTLLQGEFKDCIGVSKYHFLFSDGMKEYIAKVQERTNTVINLNKSRKTITIYGTTKNCRRAKGELFSSINTQQCSKRIFNLRDSCIPTGFMKAIYTRYGYNLDGMIYQFSLTDAHIDVSKLTLTLTGPIEHVKKAEQDLEKLCAKLYESRNNKVQSSTSEEICSICLDPLSYDYQRLEHCGHAFCRQCLLLQVESKIIPLVCVKQNCEKLIFLEDIKRIISLGDSQLKKSFCVAALQHHVSSNTDKLSYCPTPDCEMVYRITNEGSEYNCPVCKNSFCTHCQTMYHYGMSCEMFQNCKIDEDYSLKAWVKENPSVRKNCPSCKVVIEKIEGCNHMKCMNCKSHLCWLCLGIFPTGKDVYDHMPYCDKNQGQI